MELDTLKDNLLDNNIVATYLLESNSKEALMTKITTFKIAITALIMKIYELNNIEFRNISSTMQDNIMQIRINVSFSGKKKKQEIDFENDEDCKQIIDLQAQPYANNHSRYLSLPLEINVHRFTNKCIECKSDTEEELKNRTEKATLAEVKRLLKDLYIESISITRQHIHHDKEHNKYCTNIHILSTYRDLLRQEIPQEDER